MSTNNPQRSIGDWLLRRSFSFGRGFRQVFAGRRGRGCGGFPDQHIARMGVRVIETIREHLRGEVIRYQRGKAFTLFAAQCVKIIRITDLSTCNEALGKDSLLFIFFWCLWVCGGIKPFCYHFPYTGFRTSLFTGDKDNAQVYLIENRVRQMKIQMNYTAEI